MDKALPTVPVSFLRTNQAEVLSQLDTSPLILTYNGASAGVLINPDKYNELVELVKSANFRLMIARRIHEMDTDPAMELDGEEVRRQMMAAE